MTKRFFVFVFLVLLVIGTGLYYRDAADSTNYTPPSLPQEPAAVSTIAGASPCKKASHGDYEFLDLDGLAMKNIYIHLGNAYFHDKNYEKASICYDKALEIDSSSPRALFGHGRCFEFQRDYKEAQKLYCLAQAEALKRNERGLLTGNKALISDISEIRNEKKVLQIKMELEGDEVDTGDFEENGKDCLDSLDFILDSARNKDLKGEEVVTLTKFIIKQCNSLCKKEDVKPEVFLQRGMASLTYISVARTRSNNPMPYYDRAINDFETYISRGGEDPRVYLNRARALLRKAQYNDGNDYLAILALRDTNKYLKSGANHRDIYKIQGEAYYYCVMQAKDGTYGQDEKDLVKKAVNDLSKYLEMGGEDLSVYRYRGYIQYYKGNRESGEKDLIHYCENAVPVSPVEHADLGKAYRHLGVYNKAKKQLDISIKMDPGNPRFREERRNIPSNEE